MKPFSFEFDLLDESVLKKQLLQACRQFGFCCFLDSNDFTRDPYHRFDWLCGLGALKVFSHNPSPFEGLYKFHRENNDWLFGHLSYDLKNDLEDLETGHPDPIGFDRILFFVPETVIYKKETSIRVESHVFDSAGTFLKFLDIPEQTPSNFSVELKHQTSHTQYLRQVSSLMHHLEVGDIYEVNYCIEFSETSKTLDPIAVFEKLNHRSAAPFSAFYRNGEHYLCCASPERYLQKKGRKIISQPMKGTAKRSADPAEDERLKNSLRESEKERSENVMITDLVRNDLSRTSAAVKVRELFGVYSYPSVHQMISTVESTLNENCHFADVLKTTFPMGSMTGAPKISAMKLIDRHETFARNLFSGSVGYITPGGDFDFNVVIRSLLYNAKNGYLSARVGSAITVYCDPEKEYEECLLKAQNLFAALQN